MGQGPRGQGGPPPQKGTDTLHSPAPLNSGVFRAASVPNHQRRTFFLPPAVPVITLPEPTCPSPTSSLPSYYSSESPPTTHHRPPSTYAPAPSTWHPPPTSVHHPLTHHPPSEDSARSTGSAAASMRAMRGRRQPRSRSSCQPPLCGNTKRTVEFGTYGRHTPQHTPKLDPRDKRAAAAATHRAVGIGRQGDSPIHIHSFNQFQLKPERRRAEPRRLPPLRGSAPRVCSLTSRRRQGLLPKAQLANLRWESVARDRRAWGLG